MTPFQIISVILGALTLLGGIMTVYIKTVIAITKIQVEIAEIKRDLLRKEFAILNLEKYNREDHNDHVEIISKINELMKTIKL